MNFFSLQESATVLAKILLPQLFEKVPMQEVRALVAEKSTMSRYPVEESIEVPHHFIGLLLEGHIKGKEIQEELIESPAALMPLYGDTNSQESDISGKTSRKMIAQSIISVLLCTGFTNFLFLI